MEIKRLGSSDLQKANALFELLATIFDEEYQRSSDMYVQQLLDNESFWALAVFSGDTIVGGLTAHTLPLTRIASREIFIYDIAVAPEFQRQGIGTMLLKELFHQAKCDGIDECFVLADNDDLHALEFYRSSGAFGSPVTSFTFVLTNTI